MVLSFDIDGVIAEANFQKYVSIKDTFGRVSKEMYNYFDTRPPRMKWYDGIQRWLNTWYYEHANILAFTSGRGGWLYNLTADWLSGRTLWYNYTINIVDLWCLSGWKEKHKCLEVNYPGQTIIHVDDDPRVVELMRRESNIIVLPVYLESWEDYYTEHPMFREETYKDWPSLQKRLEELLKLGTTALAR